MTSGSNVYDDANAGGIQSTPVFATLGVTNGLFTTTLNFGGSVFNGSARWLEINVRTNGALDYATLAPRQPVTPAPYSIYAAAAGGVNAAAIIGTLAPAQLPDGTLTNNAGGVTLSGSFIGSGGSLTGVNAATLNGTAAAGFWQLGGNNVSNGQFLGSTNNQPVEIWAGGQRALRLEPNNDGEPNIIGGSSVNYIASGVEGSTIAGGGSSVWSNSIFTSSSSIGGGAGNSIQPGAELSFLGGGWNNSIQNAICSFLGGGANNSIQPNNSNSFLGGGEGNSIQTNAYDSFLGGGSVNSIQPNADHSFLGGGYENKIGALYSFLGGGYENSIQTNAYDSFLGGGSVNSIQPNADHSFLGGGQSNTNGAPYSIVPGGNQNFAGGTNSFAAGHRAKANYAGDFVWADSQDMDFNSTATNQFSVRAAGGAQFVTGGAGLTVDGPVFAAEYIGGSANTLGVGLTDSAIGGGNHDSIQSGSDHSFIGGGVGNSIWTNSSFSFMGAGNYNIIQGGAGLSCLVGGEYNAIQTNAIYSFLGGGAGNSIQPNAHFSVLGGGYYNSIQTNSEDSFLGGGYGNSIQPNAGESVLGGGDYNSIQTNAGNSVLGGGYYNSIQPNAAYASLAGGIQNQVGGAGGTVPGGNGNGANGVNSFAAGTQAKANHDGSFVLADMQYVDFASTAPNQLSARFTGGVRFVTGGAGLTVDGQPVLTGNNSVTVSAGTGLSGGGAVALGGSVTLNNSGVLSVGAGSPLASSGGQNPQISSERHRAHRQRRFGLCARRFVGRPIHPVIREPAPGRSIRFRRATCRASPRRMWICPAARPSAAPRTSAVRWALASAPATRWM